MDYKTLINTYGSPLYVYDYKILKERCQQIADFASTLQNSLHRKITINMHYSTKANYNPHLLKIVKETGLKVDCMSPLEVKVNELAGFTPEQMLYVCNNVTSEEMEFIHQKNILPCLDSISQVESWGKLFPNSEIMVRVNPGTTGVGHSEKVITSGKVTKFGISEPNIPSLLATCEKYHLSIIGTHQHLGSLFLDDKIDDYIAGVEAGLNISGEYFKNLKIIDLGGGFGVPYKESESPLNLKLVAEKLTPILNTFLDSHPNIIELKFEPGRFIPCESCKLIGTVTAIKHENNINWIGTDIGMNALVRPSMYDAYHHISIISDNTEQITANVCGNICESGDILGKQRFLTQPAVGDLVIIDNAGAYGYSMSSNYTGRVRGAEILIKDNKATVIRQRESVDDILKNIPPSPTH